MTTILITVEGGVVQAVCADGPVRVHLIDYDNIEAGDCVADCRDPFPVYRESRQDFTHTFENALKDAAEREGKNA